MSNYVVVDDTTGAIIKGGDAPDSMIAIQAGPGETAIALPPGVLAWPDPNLDVYRNHLYATVDAAADAFCLTFISAGATQMLRYLRKEAEARAWTSGDDPVGAPFLASEAAATGVTIDDLAAIVITKADAWTAIGAAVEGARLAAKQTILEATNIAEMHAASQVDWASLIQ